LQRFRLLCANNQKTHRPAILAVGFARSDCSYPKPATSRRQRRQNNRRNTAPRKPSSSKSTWTYS